MKDVTQFKIDVPQASISFNKLGVVYADFATATTAALGAITPGSVVVAQVGTDVYLFVDSAGDGGTFEDEIKLVGVSYAGIVASDVI